MIPNSLPYIEIKNPPLKLLIDTGCHASLLRPIIAETYFPEKIKLKKNPISTCAGTRYAQHIAKIPLLAEYELENTWLDFILFDFHEYFDGIIGIRDLRNLNLNLDLNAKLLYNKYITIPLQYRKDFNSQKIEIPSNSSVIKRIRTILPNGDILIPDLSGLNDKVVIPASLLSVQDGHVKLEFINTSNYSQIFTINENFLNDFKLQFNEDNYECYNMEQIINTHNNINNTSLDLDNDLRLNHLNPEERVALIKTIKQYKDIFHHNDNKLTFTHEIKHEIKTTDNIPVHTKSYRYPYIHKDEVKRQINKMLDDGIIRPSQSPWSSPIWIVPKKMDASGKQKWRIVVDYRKINEKTIDDRYPMPNITEILDKLGRCQYFTTLDLASGFHQIEMDPDSIDKTAFNVENGHYEYLRMPFGLKNAPATFQRVVDRVLKNEIGKICLIYMDDIIIFSTSLQEHINSIKIVFNRLRDAGLKIQLDKSEFLSKSVEFLGHIVTPEGIKPNEKKIIAIKKFPIPNTQKEIKSFLGLIGYYRRFIKNFAKLTKPLTLCLKKGTQIKHTPEFVESFELCKNILMNDPILQYPDFNKPFNVTTDASNFAIGAVLSQGPIGKDLPIAYASRTLNTAETHYSTIEKELLAIVYAVKYFRPYLYGTKFSIICDHKPLQWLFSLKEPNSKLVRWKLQLEEYDYKIIYKQGKLNTNADALSRIEINPIETTDIDPLDLDDNASVYANFDQNEIPILTQDVLDDLLYEDIPSLEPQEVRKTYETQPTIKNKNKIKILQNIILKPPEKPQDDSTDLETVHTSLENPILNIPFTEKTINIYKNQLIISKTKSDKPKHSFEKIFDKNRHFWQISENMNETQWINLIKETLKPKLTYCLYFKNEEYKIPFINFMTKNFQYNSFNLVISNKIVTDIINEEERKEKILFYHETKTNHRGINENITALKKHFYWPEMDKDVMNYVNTCEVCQKSKYERHPYSLVLKPTPIGQSPLEHLYIDTFIYTHQKFLTIIDSFSKFGQAYPINSSSAIEIANKLIHFISHYGIPNKITCDGGTEFKNHVIQDFCLLHQIDIHYTTAYNPNSNSPVERFHSTLIESLRILREEKPDTIITHLMNYAILSYNNSIHTATNYTPFQILRGKLDYKNPFERSENERISDYINEHSQNLNILADFINNKLTKKQKDDLERANRHRKREIKLDLNKPLYKQNLPNSREDKSSQPYEKITDPKLIGDNKILSNDRILHLRNLKPQRFVPDRKDEMSDDSIDNLPLDQRIHDS